MNINFKIHNPNHIVKNILGNIEYAFPHLGLQKNELTVVNYHGTQKKFLNNFRKQIDFFQKEFFIISPHQLNDFYSGKLVHDSLPLLLLTFDDGVKNNLYAINELESRGIKAFFFVIPDFINTPKDKQKDFFIRNIRPEINYGIDDKEEDFIAMSWDDLKTLQVKGHCIGSHTQTHTLITRQSTLENSIIEIKDSKVNIANALTSPLTLTNSFCSINNTLESISSKEVSLIKENYQYHFTTIPGFNIPSSNPYYIKRANIESHWLSGSVKFALGKWDLKRWEKVDKRFLRILENVL